MRWLDIKLDVMTAKKTRHMSWEDMAYYLKATRGMNELNKVDRFLTGMTHSDFDPK